MSVSNGFSMQMVRRRPEEDGAIALALPQLILEIPVDQDPTVAEFSTATTSHHRVVVPLSELRICCVASVAPVIHLTLSTQR